MLMHCNQCEQTTKGVCCVKIGTCGKDPKLALAQDELVAALIAAAPVVEANAQNAALFATPRTPPSLKRRSLRRSRTSTSTATRSTRSRPK